MAFVCPEKSQKRKSLLSSLKDLVNQIDDSCPSPCCPQPCLAIPQCTPGTCPPQSTTVPVCMPPNNPPICVPPILPICKPVPPPCVPICNPNPEEQPCVPCHPPQMMVCYRRPKESYARQSKSRELRASILHVGCDCEKHNGLQDDCPRSECHGSPDCLTLPDPTCGPSAYSGGKHFGSKADNGLEQYQCYPAYIKLPQCPPCGGAPQANSPPSCPPFCLPSSPPFCPPSCGPCCPPCCPPPSVPLIAQAPCPPPIQPACPPMVPVGRVVPVAPAVPCPIMCPPPMACAPPTGGVQCCPAPCCPCPC